MQTFLPYPDFRESARVLDRSRLGKQRVEAFQIMRALKDSTYGWQNHPAVKMWRGYEGSLNEYYKSIVYEWVSRGYSHNMPMTLSDDAVIHPPWLGREDFHASHRSALT